MVILMKHLEIDGKITGTSSNFTKEKGERLSLTVREHKGILSPTGKVTLEFDEQATKDLMSNLGSDAPLKMKRTLDGGLIRIIIR